MIKRIVKIVLLTAFAGGVVYTFWFLYKKSETKPVVYETSEPYYTDIVKKTVATGTVKPRKEIEIKPQVSGIIEQLYVQAGDAVKTGDLIARVRIIPNMVNMSNAENRLNRSKIALENAKLDYDRNEKLFQQKVIAISDFQQFRINYENAKEELKAAEDNLEIIKKGVAKSSSTATLTLVRSTVSGMVLDVPVEEGFSVIEVNNFNVGTTIAFVANLDDMIFEGKIDESEVGKIKEGMNLILTIGAIDRAKFDAVLEFIAPKGVSENGAIQFKIKAAVKQRPDYFIRAGYSANADIVLERRDSVLAVKESMLIFDNGDTFVEIENGKPQEFERRKIKTGLSDGVNIEILEGIQEKDKIKLPIAVTEQKKAES